MGEQVEQLQRMRNVIDSLTRENQKLLQISAKNQCASCASSGSDSSLPYSPSMSEGTDDDVEEEKDEVLTFPKGMALKRNPYGISRRHGGRHGLRRHLV